MSRDIRKLFQKNVRGKLSEQGNGGFFELEGRKMCGQDDRKNSVRGRENRPNRAENRTGKEQNICISGRGKG